MTLEKFKDVLIPIELVWYAYYDKDDNTTNVVVLTPGYAGMSRNIEICGNCLKQFNKWYNDKSAQVKESPGMNSRGDTPAPYMPPPVMPGPETTWFTKSTTTTICSDVNQSEG